MRRLIQRDQFAGTPGMVWLDIQETQKRIAVTQQAIAQADENLKVTTDRYQQGLSTNTDVLKAEDLRIMTHDNFNNASYDSALATLHLRRALSIL
ncbi:MAG: TolC family protein [Methylobacter sp.]|jgi:outer membrane protein TolC